MKDQPFIHGKAPPPNPPLGSYLPNYQTGVVETWLHKQLSPADWVLCPFGSSPQIAIEAARAGFRVLTPIHNPILRFLVKVSAAPPSREDLNSALVKLASSYKGDERLKPHILSLYETDCPLCSQTTSAVSFIWDESSREPSQKICRCAACSEESSAEVTESDREKALAFSERSPTHARALTRVISPADPIRFQVEKALASYPPRSVYALFTALNKVSGFSLPPEEKTHLEILLLHAFSQCSQTLIHTGEEEQPNGTYREENVWYAMADALDYWTGDARPIPITHWPESPPRSGGISVFPGRIKELTPQLVGFPIQGLVMSFPSPTPEFWSLSALWSGWLWGQEAAAPLRGVLSSRDLDWAWMTHAIQVTLQELGEVLPAQVPTLGLMPGVETKSLLSWMSAALAAGLGWESLALDPDLHQGQSWWKINPPTAEQQQAGNHRLMIREAGLELLKSAGEPKHTLSLYGAGTANMAQAGYPDPESKMAQAGDYYQQLGIDFEENIAYRQGFLHYPGIESWWHQELDLVPQTDSDRIEMLLVRTLLERNGVAQESHLFQALYDQFPGLGTPRHSLIEACLRSYAERDPGPPASWALKANDQPSRRLDDIREMAQIMTSIGIDLGYQPHKEEAPDQLAVVIWADQGINAETFYIAASGLLNKILSQGLGSFERGWMILPGSRAGLIHYKMDHNPILAEIIQDQWQLIKFRHLRRLQEQGGLTRENFKERCCLDPFTSDSPQLPLI